MSNQSQIKKPIRKEDISGSETVLEKIRTGTPWFLGDSIRKPKIKFPRISSRRRIDMPMPSKSIGLIMIYIILFILQTGVLYIVYRNPPAIGANQNGDAILLYPGISEQFIIEGIVASIVIFISSTGYILLYQASKYVYDRSTAIKVLAIGFLFVIVSFIALQFMLAVKTDQIRSFLESLLQVYG